MKLILELIKMLLSSEGDGISYSTAQKIKDALLFILLGMALMVGIILYMDDDEEPADESTPIEVVDDKA